MLAPLALLFVVVPIVELYVIVQAGQAFGVPETIVALLLVSVFGAWLVRREGLGVVMRARRQLDAGRVPATEMVDGVLILFAGALLLTPGFITDAFGVLLLLPPVRAVVRSSALRLLRFRIVGM